MNRKRYGTGDGVSMVGGEWAQKDASLAQAIADAARVRASLPQLPAPSRDGRLAVATAGRGSLNRHVVRHRVWAQGNPLQAHPVGRAVPAEEMVRAQVNPPALGRDRQRE